jgi:uncharacterized protein YcbK (DUF882 family)
MHLRRRDFLLATGLTLVFGPSANARILGESEPYVFPPLSTPRRLTLRHAHTGETFSGPYRDAFGPIPEAMVDLAIFLRDHRENITGPVYIETLDFLADVIENAGQARATILSAYRTKKTNDMLRSRLFGVAEKSQHLAGRALDITLDSNLSSAAKLARKMTRGGVGWYPRSHFIHLDTGPIRNWTIDYRDAVSDSDNYLLSAKPKGPLSVRDRLRLQRALAKRQMRGRVHTFKPAKPGS